MANRYKRYRNVASGDSTVFYTDDPEIVNSLSTYDIKQEIDRAITRPRFRLQWLNPDETIREILPEEDIISGGSYSENYQNGQRRNLSINLYNESGKYTPSINGLWAGVKFGFDMGLELDDGTVLWFPKGVYSLTNISVNHGTSDKTVSLTLNDKYSILEGAQGALEGTITIEPGTLIEDIVRDTLALSTGSGYMLDPKPFIYDSSFKGQRTQATITKQAGDNYGSLILELATMLSAEVFYDVQGQLNFVPINNVSNDVDKPVIYHYYESHGDFGSNNLTFDLNSIINRVIVIGATVNGEICDATAVNDDPASPLCYQRIGYRTASPINDNNITSTLLAQERADYELRQKLILKSSVSNDVRFNPLLLVNNLISVTDDFYGFKQEKFLLQSISCSIDYSGTMSISTSNARNIPFVVGG